MSQLIKSIRDWITKPDFSDPDRNLSAFYVQSIVLLIIPAASIIALAYIVVHRFDYVLLILLSILALVFVLVLIRYKRLQLALNLFLVFILGLLTFGVFWGGGIHASSSILYPVILIFSSMILNRRSFIVYSLLCFVCIGFLVYAENQHISPPYVPDPANFAFFISFSLIVASTAILIRFGTESLQDNLQKTRQTMRELAAQKAMLDHVGQAVVGCRADNTIMYWNQASEYMYGWKADEVLGKKYYEVIPTELTPEKIEELRVGLQSGQVWSGETRIQKRDKSSRSVLITVAPLNDSNNSVSGWIGIAADLTAQKENERIAKNKADEISLLYQFGISVASGRDLHSTLLALHDEIINLLNLDIFYVAIYDKETDVVNFPIFIDGNGFFELPTRLLHDGPGLTGHTISNESTLYIRDLTDPQVQETYHPRDNDNPHLHTYLGIPLKVNDSVIGMLSIQSKLIDAYTNDQIKLMENLAVHAAIAVNKAQLLDRLTRELAERKHAEEKYRAIFNNAIDGIFQSTTSGVFQSVNPAMARMYGYESPQEMIHEITDIAKQMYAEPEKRQELGRRLAQGEQVAGFESLDYRKDGSIFWTSMNVQAIQTPDGNISYYEGTIEDISQRKEVEAERENLLQELAAKNSELERFTYTVSHDLKSPLVTISGFLGFLERDLASGKPDRVKKDVQRIQDAVNKMQRLLGELLELSRIGRIKNVMEVISFDDLLREALSLVHGNLQARKITVLIQPGLPAVYGDKSRLIEVMQNLIENSAKYMGDQPQPKIEIGQHGYENGRAVFFVKDNGIGIAPQYHERIFDLFEKLDVNVEGTGVGLAIVKRIVDIHGGRIWVESEAGHGSTFYFTLSGPPETVS